MDHVAFHSLIGAIVTTLIQGLSRFVAEVLGPHVRPENQGPALLRVKDVAIGRRGGEYRSRDLSLMLPAMMERLGAVEPPFTRHTSWQAEVHSCGLREVSNQRTYSDQPTAARAYRAIDSEELLLRAVGADDQVTEVGQLYAAVAPVPAAPPTPDLDAVVGRAVASRPSEKPREPNPTSLGMPWIKIAAVTDLSYAMAHCRIPIVEHITGSDLRGAVIDVDVVSADGSHGRPSDVHRGLAAHRPTVLRSVDLKLDAGSMLCPTGCQRYMRF